MAHIPFNELRRLIRLHMNWLTFAVLGEDALMPEEYEELKNYGKLPMESLDLVDTSYVLGRMKSFMKAQEYRTVSLAEAKEQKDNANYTDVERLAIEHARFRAGQHLKGLEDDITSGIFKSLQTVMGQALSAESIRAIVRQETEAALAAKKSYQELASTLAAKTMAAHGRDWKRVSRTEMHRAKVAGTTQAIVNKLGPYRGGDGPDSDVVIIPGPNCCEDCEHHYLDINGVPRVFKLSDLLAAGSNADSGVSHKRNELGVHGYWKTTLPPLHPNCGCTVQYLPPGTSVVDRRGTLVVKSLFQYEEALMKAEGETGIGNPVAKPPGPPQTSKPATPPSTTGAKSPGQKITAKAPSGGGKGPSMAGLNLRYVPKNSVSKRPSGTIRETDSSYVVMPGMKSGQAPTEEMKAMMRKDEQQRAISYTKRSVNTQHHKKIKSLQTAEITTKEPLNKGVSESYCATLKEGGRACMKPSHQMPESVMASEAWTEGCATIPHGSGAHAEVGAYKAYSMMGLTEHVPPTSVRMDEKGRKNSMQEWQEDFEVMESDSAVMKKAKAISGENNPAAAIIKGAPPEHQEKIRKKLCEHVVMCGVLNHNDSHAGNMMLKKDGTDVRFIDSTATGGNGMADHKNGMFYAMHSAGMKVTIPDDMNERFKKTTFQDMKRSLGGDYKDWQVGQSFMRMRYMQALQDRDGELDHNYFRTTTTAQSGDMINRIGNGPMGVGQGVSAYDKMKDFAHKRDNQLLPHDVFESWSKQYISDVMKNPEHPDFHSISEIDQTGIFMPNGLDVMKDPDAARRDNKHRDYEKTIVARNIPTRGQMAGHDHYEVPDDMSIPKTRDRAMESGKTAPADAKGSKPTNPDDDPDKTVKPAIKKGLYLSWGNLHKRLDTH